MFDELKKVNYFKKEEEEEKKKTGSGVLQCKILLTCFHKLRKTPSCKIMYLSIVRTKRNDDLLIAPDNMQKKHLLLQIHTITHVLLMSIKCTNNNLNFKAQ